MLRACDCDLYLFIYAGSFRILDMRIAFSPLVGGNTVCELNVVGCAQCGHDFKDLYYAHLLLASEADVNAFGVVSGFTHRWL